MVLLIAMLKAIIKIFLIFFAFLLGFWIAFKNTLKMGIIKVPDVKNKSLEEAEKILKSNNLDYILDINLSGYSNDIRQGFILKQEPEAGSFIKVENKVRLGLSLGSPKITIPNLIKKHFHEVELYVRSQNLKIGKISYIDLPEEESIIISQFPPPLSTASPDTPIDLLICKPDDSISYIMPDFLNKNYEFILTELVSKGFKVEKPREIKIPHYETGIILSQSPLPGTKIKKNTPIVFTINVGI